MKTHPVNIDFIYIQRHVFYNKTGKPPDYVMIHINNKFKIYKEAEQSNIGDLIQQIINRRIFGMKLIWTSDIQTNEVICTGGIN